MSTTAIAVKGLTDQQRHVIEGIHAGDFLWIQKVLPAPNDEDTEDSPEEGSDDVESGVDWEGDAANLVRSSEDQSDSDEATGSSDEEDAESSTPQSELQSEDQADGFYRIYLVLELIQDESSTVSDIKLVELRFNTDVNGEDAEHSLQVYGPQLSYTSSNKCKHIDCSLSTTLGTLATDTGFQNHLLHLKPDGDMVRSLSSRGRCPASCVNGFLSTLQELNGLFRQYTIPTTLQHTPVCPVCIGLDLAIESLELKASLEATHMVDLGQVMEHLSRLNPRRARLGYPFRQFDEREWGYMFEDMLEDESDVDENGNHYEYWYEAMDPNANIKTRPASEATIAALTRKPFMETEAAKAGNGRSDQDGLRCGVCLEKAQLDKIAVELPCKHVFEEECITKWLKQFANCPTCRAEIQAVDNDNMKDTADDSVNQSAKPVGNGQSDGQAMEDGEPDRDGEDVFMADA